MAFFKLTVGEAPSRLKVAPSFSEALSHSFAIMFLPLLEVFKLEFAD